MSDFPWPETAATLRSFEGYLQKKELPERHVSSSRYAAVIHGVLRFYLPCQDEQGAVIDPEFRKEWHYSTPCFALAAAFLAARGQGEYLHPALKAMKWSARSLAEGRCPQNHPNFYILPLMTADELLRDLAPEGDRASWKADLRSLDPWRVYRGHHREQEDRQLHNWNAMTLAGEYRRFRSGFTQNREYVDVHIPYHLARMSEEGWYRDGPLGDDGIIKQPMAYDLVGRSVLIDLIRQGWDGPEREALEEKLIRGVQTQLFFQEPNGEYPCAGRSAHHIWNEAYLAQCAEWGAGRFKTSRPSLAAAFRRQAELALDVIEQWQSGEGRLSILKNRFLPEERQGFERYSVSTTYNMWSLAALVNAALWADEEIPVGEIPSECFSYAVKTTRDFHQAACAHQGRFALADCCGDPAYNPTGLHRLAKKGSPGDLGPLEGSVANPHFSLLSEGEFLSHSPEWMDRLGNWQSFARFQTLPFVNEPPFPYQPDVRQEIGTDKTTLILHWQGGFWGAKSILTEITLDARGFLIRHTLEGQIGKVRAALPLFYSDGLTVSEIKLRDGEIILRFKGAEQRIALAEGTEWELRDQVIGSRRGLLKRAYLYGERTLAYRIVMGG